MAEDEEAIFVSDLCLRHYAGGGSSLLEFSCPGVTGGDSGMFLGTAFCRTVGCWLEFI